MYAATRIPGADLDVAPDWLADAGDCVPEPEITAAELTALRLIDPEGCYR